MSRRDAAARQERLARRAASHADRGELPPPDAAAPSPRGEASGDSGLRREPALPLRRVISMHPSI